MCISLLRVVNTIYKRNFTEMTIEKNTESNITNSKCLGGGDITSYILLGKSNLPYYNVPIDCY